VGDFLGNGQSDLVWENIVTAEHAIWILNNGVFQYVIKLPTFSGGWQIAGAADFNGEVRRISFGKILCAAPVLSGCQITAFALPASLFAPSPLRGTSWITKERSGIDGAYTYRSAISVSLGGGDYFDYEMQVKWPARQRDYQTTAQWNPRNTRPFALRQMPLDRFCRRVNAKLLAVLSDQNRGQHERYLAPYRLIQKRGKEIARAFDDFRRSTAVFQIAIIRKLGVITDEELGRFSKEVQASLVCDQSPGEIQNAIF
jgi:hypothetical protein